MSPKIVRCLMLPLLLMPLGIAAQQDPIAAAKAIHNPGDRNADRSVIALLLPLEEAGKLDDADALNMLGLSCIQPLVPAREQHPCRNRLGELFVKAAERGNVSAMYGASHWLMDKPARGMFYTDAQRVESLAWAMLALHFNTDAGQRDALNRIVAQKTSELARQSRGNESLAQRAAGLAESRKAALTPLVARQQLAASGLPALPDNLPDSVGRWLGQASFIDNATTTYSAAAGRRGVDHDALERDTKRNLVRFVSGIYTGKALAQFTRFINEAPMETSWDNSPFGIALFESGDKIASVTATGSDRYDVLIQSRRCYSEPAEYDAPEIRTLVASHKVSNATQARVNQWARGANDNTYKHYCLDTQKSFALTVDPGTKLISDYNGTVRNSTIEFDAEE